MTENLSDRCLNVSGGWICTRPKNHDGNHVSDLHRDQILSGERSYVLAMDRLRRLLSVEDNEKET